MFSVWRSTATTAATMRKPIVRLLRAVGVPSDNRRKISAKIGSDTAARMLANDT